MVDLPLLTEVFDSWADLRLPPGACYIHARSDEARTVHPAEWELAHPDVRFHEVRDQGRLAFNLDWDGGSRTTFLRSSEGLARLVEGLPDCVFLDVTALLHEVWAPLLRALMRAQKVVRVVYVEPDEYRYSTDPTEGRRFELTERFTELGGFPGFARFSEPEDESKVCFIPLLGFEGNRLAHAIEKVDPPEGKVIPVVGVPGFRADFPFHTYVGNRVPLLRRGLWKQVRYAAANSPFSLLYCLERIAAEHRGHLLKIAPLGTRPHAVGALLFFLQRQESVELVYDHPTPAASRSAGTGSILVYDVSALGIAIK